MEYGGMDQGGQVGAGRENRHSRMGIASFAIGVLSIIAIVLFFVIAFSAAASVVGEDPQNFDPSSIDETSPLATTFTLVGLGLIGSILLTVVGLGLGIAGLIQRRRRKLFATLGTILNGLVVLGVIALFVLGIAFSAAGSV